MRGAPVSMILRITRLPAPLRGGSRTSRSGRPDLLVLDPPRSGAGSRVMRKIIDTGAPRMVYVSCNPTTLAPDLGDLVRGGYALRAVQPLDQFPHTYHVECAVLLERAGPPQPA